MIEKVGKFLDTIGADKSVMARMDKCIEENGELIDAYCMVSDTSLISETCDRIITGYALLLSLGGTEQTIIDKMAEVVARPEYQFEAPPMIGMVDQEMARLERIVENTLRELKYFDCPGYIYDDAWNYIGCSEDCEPDDEKEKACWIKWLEREVVR